LSIAEMTLADDDYEKEREDLAVVDAVGITNKITEELLALLGRHVA
jgi:hypothetical protein